MDLLLDHPRAQLYCGDCRDLSALTTTADLIVTDPPYGQQWQSDYRATAFDVIEGDHSPAMGLAGLRAAITRLRPYRHVYVFGPPIDQSALPLAKQVELIWDKGMTGVGDLSSPWGLQHEPIHFTTYIPDRANRARGRGGLSARLRRGSILRYPRLNSAQVRRHPTEKPVPLLRQLIESSSCVDEWVFDPFMGVGSTVVAALLEGRRGIGIEIDIVYALHALARVERVLTLLEPLTDTL